MADQPKKKPEKNKVMNTDRGNRKAAKTRPDGFFRHGAEYRGSHTRKSPQNDLQKVLMGQGMLRHAARQHVGSTEGRWTLQSTVHQPYDAAQARENRRLYPHLFADR